MEKEEANAAIDVKGEVVVVKQQKKQSVLVVEGEGWEKEKRQQSLYMWLKIAPHVGTATSREKLQFHSPGNETRKHNPNPSHF